MRERAKRYLSAFRRFLLLQGISTLIALVLLEIGVFIFLPRVEDYFVFHPQRGLDSTPQSYGLDHKDVIFDTPDGARLYGWYFPPPQGGPVILFCHGNAGNISHQLGNVGGLVHAGLGVFVFDYRGFGKSEGEPSEKGIYADGLAAYDYLVQQESVSSDAIVPFGRSLGGAVALEVSVKRRVRCTILESTFTSLRDIARAITFFKPFSPLVPRHYDNMDKIGKLRAPLLIFHGTEDKLVPFSMGRALFDHANEPKFFYPIEGAGHDDTFVVGGRDYYRRFTRFAREGR